MKRGHWALDWWYSPFVHIHGHSCFWNEVLALWSISTMLRRTAFTFWNWTRGRMVDRKVWTWFEHGIHVPGISWPITYFMLFVGWFSMFHAQRWHITPPIHKRNVDGWLNHQTYLFWNPAGYRWSTLWLKPLREWPLVAVENGIGSDRGLIPNMSDFTGLEGTVVGRHGFLTITIQCGVLVSCVRNVASIQGSRMPWD